MFKNFLLSSESRLSSSYYWSSNALTNDSLPYISEMMHISNKPINLLSAIFKEFHPSLQFAAAELWNKLPSNHKNHKLLTTINFFKRKPSFKECFNL